MAPNRARAGDDSRQEASSVPATKHANAATGAGVSKGKRAANAAAAAANKPKDIQSVGDSSSTSEPAPGVNWTAVPANVLHAYRHAYKVDTPPAFASFETQLSLTNPEGLGKFSPSMARRKEKRRIPKETLAMAIRKDFNAAAVNETEVLTSFLYSVKNKKKPFRMRFNPGKSK